MTTQKTFTSFICRPDAFLTLDTIVSREQLDAAHAMLFEEVENDGSLDFVYQQLSYVPDASKGLGGDPVTVNCIDCGYLHNPSSDTIYVDDNGHYNNVNDTWLVFRGGFQPYAGRALVVGLSDEGETAAPTTITMDWLIANTVVLCQNLIYVPRLRTGGHTPYPAIMYASMKEMHSYDHPIWTATSYP